MKKTIIAALVLAVTAAGALIVYGQTGEGDAQGKRGFGRHGKMHKRGGMMGARMFRHLDLTDEQKEQLRAIRTEAREANKDLHMSLRETRRQLGELGLDGNLDSVQLEALAAQQAEIMKKLTIARQQTKVQMHAVLTPEQKSKLVEMKAKFEEFRKQRAERRKARSPEKSGDQ